MVKIPRGKKTKNQHSTFNFCRGKTYLTHFFWVSVTAVILLKDNTNCQLGNYLVSFIMGSRVGAVVGVLAFYRCVLGSIPELGVNCMEFRIVKIIIVRRI